MAHESISMEEIVAFFQKEDPIKPVKIEHGFDVIVVEGELEQWYNFLWYRFERNGLAMTARSYLDEIETVSVFGPMKIENERDYVEDAEFIAMVTDYFKKRYNQIDKLGDEGYVTIGGVIRFDYCD